MIGATLTHYRITAKLMEGRMGEVFRAQDSHLTRDMAALLLPTDCQTKFRRREAPCQQRQGTARYRCEIEGRTLW